MPLSFPTIEELAQAERDGNPAMSLSGLDPLVFPTVGELATAEQEQERVRTPQGLFWLLFRDQPQALLQAALENEEAFADVLPLLHALHNDPRRPISEAERGLLNKAAARAVQTPDPKRPLPTPPKVAAPRPVKAPEAAKAPIPEDIEVRPFFWLE